MLGLILRSLVTALVSATVTEVTTKGWHQPVDKVGAAVPYIREVRIVATISESSHSTEADFLFNNTLSHFRMIIIQPGSAR